MHDSLELLALAPGDFKIVKQHSGKIRPLPKIDTS